MLEESGANGVMISLASVEPELVNRLTRQLTDAGYHVALSSGLRDIDIVRFRAQDVGGHTLIYVEPTMRDGWRAIAKRVFDVSLSIVALVLATPDPGRRGDRDQARVPGRSHLRPGAGRT